VAWCDSELEIRERLDAIEEGETDGIVVLTPIDAAGLACDVVARFPRARLEETDRWAALRTAFRARDIDPRLRAHRWLADMLLESAPSVGYPPAAGGVLDLETAWRAAQERLLGLPEGRADTAALLWWTLDEANPCRLADLPIEARARMVERLAAAGGPAATLVMGAVAAGRGFEAFAVGLVCGVVFAGGHPQDDLRESAVRLEPLVGGQRIDAEAGAALAEAARRMLMRLDSGESAARTVQAQAAALLTEVRAERYAGLSPALVVGLEARMRDAAVALNVAVSSGAQNDVRRASDLVRLAIEHDRAADQRTRIERFEMAARLCRWLVSGRRPATSLAEAAVAYATEDGFADRARHALRPGDEVPEVAAAYARIREAAEVRREAQNQKFAELLREWNAAGSFGTDPLPIERVLDTVVGPLARETPVLLLVLDGLSFSVYRVLAETLARQGWVTLARRDDPLPKAAAAALPTVTEISRASLLCGTLVRGDQAAERTGFAAHPALVAVSRAGRPPRLFHKAGLGGGPELEVEVRDAVADPAQRVVGVVHNAVDAQLSGSDQLDLEWSSEALRQVAALLRVARDVNRAIVVIGDHGHVLEEGTTQWTGGPGDRWRNSAQRSGEGEIALAGGRVRAPDGSLSVVAAWSEHVRYAARRVGYHGGASPQEVLVPIGVLGSGKPPSGWYAAPPVEPQWWYGVDREQPPRAAATPTAPLGHPTSLRGTDALQPDLFTPPRPPVGVATGIAATHIMPAWIEIVLNSPIYEAQRLLAGRSAPGADQVRALLSSLSARSGRLSRPALAQALSAPIFRIGGLVNAARRVLNVDQAQVLAIDGEEVVLNETLLRLQFELDGSS
jgi:hypothetical protein